MSKPVEPIDPVEPIEPVEAVALERLAREMRGGLASLRAAWEALERFPGMEADQRRRLQVVVGEELERLTRGVDRLDDLGRPLGPNRRRIEVGVLQEDLGRGLAATGLQVEMEDIPTTLGGREVEVGLDALRRGVGELAGALRRDFAVAHCRLATSEVDGHLLVDWSWVPEAGVESKLQDWQAEVLEVGREGAPGLRPITQSEGGEAWFSLDRTAGPDGGRARFRFLLPLSPPAVGP